VEKDALKAVLGQLDIWWWGSVTNRMAGLSDDEFFWKPVPDAFCLSRRGDDLFYEWPPGSRGECEPPVTTIAWRLSHVAQGCFMHRWHTYFGPRPIDWTTQPFPAHAADALAYLETWKTRWQESVLDAANDGLWQTIGDREGDIPIMQLGREDPFIGLALHMNREVMHHGAEICLLRDLYRARTVT
jgi:hypothetical protein